MGKVTATDKTDIRTSPSPRANKYEAADFNDLKASINALYDVSGWANYSDSVASNIVVGETPVLITINELDLNTNEDYLPKEIRGTSSLWSNNKITPVRIGDAYDTRLNFTIASKSGNPTRIDFVLDIGGLSTPTINIAERSIPTAKTPPYPDLFTVPIFSLATFVANGGQIFANVDTGSVTISNRSIFIKRTHSEL